MSKGQSLTSKMMQGRTVFESSRQFALLQEDVETVFAYLEQISPECRTVAYEGASMALALNDFSKGQNPALWPLFVKNAAALYIPDIYTGLGCALAQDGQPLADFLPLAEPAMHYRIADGYGFYQGMFRQRHALQQQNFPEGLDNLYLRYYDQGLGRSLWYTAAGDTGKITQCIQRFSAERQAELWRGIGIAASYLGGSDEARLSRLFSSSDYQPQLRSGAAISARARSQSGTCGADLELACRLWCSMDATQAAALAETHLNETASEPASSYHAWMRALDKQFESSPRYQFSS